MYTKTAILQFYLEESSEVHHILLSETLKNISGKIFETALNDYIWLAERGKIYTSSFYGCRKKIINMQIMYFGKFFKNSIKLIRSPYSRHFETWTLRHLRSWTFKRLQNSRTWHYGASALGQSSHLRHWVLKLQIELVMAED